MGGASDLERIFVIFLYNLTKIGEKYNNFI